MECFVVAVAVPYRYRTVGRAALKGMCLRRRMPYPRDTTRLRLSLLACCSREPVRPYDKYSRTRLFYYRTVLAL